MASTRFATFFRQLRALMYKNFLVIVVRSPLSFLLLVYGIPLAILGVLLSVPTFVQSSNKFGIASPAPIKSLADTIQKKLVIVRPPDLASDVDRVIDTLTEPLSKELVQIIDSEASLSTICLANLRGVSDCFAAVTFVDSPETTHQIDNDLRTGSTGDTQAAKNHTWQYVVRADPARDNVKFDATTHMSDQERFYMPLQLAINSAITNSTVVPEVFMFSDDTQETQDHEDQLNTVSLVGETYVFALFGCYLFIIYTFTGFITSEREAGMSQLIDAMGGSGTSSARVLSWLFTFNLACLPCFIVFGVLYWYILFPTTPVSLLIGWQILLGLAVNSSTVFAASFFTKSRVSAIYIIGVFLLLAVAAQVYGFQLHPLPQPVGAYTLSALFPSSNHVFFAQQMCLWELNSTNAHIHDIPPEALGLNSHSYNMTQATMLGFLAIHISVYPILAMLVERYMHGIDFRHRTFAGDKSAPSNYVAETFNLKKRFVPGFFTRLFCCGKRKPLTAVDGVSLRGHKGQILCLVGPNGSGKTTTLHMMSGFISPTEGKVKLDAQPSQIGICPQRNTFWEDLTVQEHINLWNQIKSGNENRETISQLISSCDLAHKSTSKAKTLSGGQKRKLQLACMFVGDSSVCLIDECTSGLDPLSRRVIWEILLQQRSKRSIIFTTHFLDEIDVLADHIVILYKGKVRCQGAAAELKNLYGGGYKVMVPLDAPRADQQYPSSIHQDRVVYATPDSRSAAQLSAYYTGAGISDVAISGPQVEDVFLRVANEPELELNKGFTETVPSGFQMSPGRTTSFWSQYRTLLRKRFTVLLRFWWPYLYVLALPIIITPNFKDLLKEFVPPTCTNLESDIYPGFASTFYFSEGCGDSCNTVILAPQAANDSLFDVVHDKYYSVGSIQAASYNEFVDVVDGRQQLIKQIKKERATSSGGIYAGSKEDAPVIAYMVGRYGMQTGGLMLNLWSQMEGDIEIVSSTAGFAQKEKSAANIGVIYVVFFTLVQALYPAAFTLYPAIEKKQKIRALEYANGVRRGPLWVAYGTFDFMFVLVIAVVITAVMNTQVIWNGPIWLMIPILTLYGLAAILLGYVVSHFTSGPLQAFLAMMGVSLVMYGASAIAFAVGSGYADVAQMDSITLGITFGLYLFLPIGNVFRSLLLGLNVLQVGCKDGEHTPPGSIYAYGAPILYLVIQIAALLLIIIWIEGDIALFRRKRRSPLRDHPERGMALKATEVEAERARAENAETDLLRALHLNKSFGSNQAVDDVTLGLPQSEVLALIGPNGAGKSTLVNMIQSELSPDRGRVLLKGEDSRMRSAQKYLGVCPQYDALDMMNTRDQLSFYAQIKGITAVQANVDHVMARLNLTPHARTLASNLSGGNKRKLSLAIALMGTPPVLVLDEPTSAMDAVAKRGFWKIIQEITPNRSVLLTTHSMEEADTLATRAAIISRRLLAVGTTQALRAKYSNLYYVGLVLRTAPTSSEAEMAVVREWIHERVPGSQLERDMLGGQVRFTMPGAPDSRGRSPVAGLIELLEREKDDIGVEYYSIGGATLERVFLNVVRENNVQEEDGVESKGFVFRRRLKRWSGGWMRLGK